MKTLFDAHIEPAGYDYEFTILGDPKAQGRPRTRVIQPKSGRKAFATIYETKEDKAAKEHIRISVEPYKPDELLDSPLRVDVFFYLKRPMNHYGTGKNSGVLRNGLRKYTISVSRIGITLISWY